MPKTFFPNPEGTIGFASQRVTLAMAKYLNEKFEKLGIDINMNQWGFIYYLFKNDKLLVKEIPKKFLLSESDISEIVKELQKKEWVSFKKNKQNEEFLTLTLKGTAQVFQLMPVLGEALVFFRGDINSQEMIITINVLNKIYHHIYPDEELYVLKAPPLFEREN
jgi:DNA-binding MarR family transcriptional regulator